MTLYRRGSIIYKTSRPFNQQITLRHSRNLYMAKLKSMSWNKRERETLVSLSNFMRQLCGFLTIKLTLFAVGNS